MVKGAAMTFIPHPAPWRDSFDEWRCFYTGFFSKLPVISGNFLTPPLEKGDLTMQNAAF
jgi:hypothetical protein